jgi:type II secretory pathway component PulK
MTLRCSNSGRRGSALLLVLWAIFLLAMATVAWTGWVVSDVERAGNASRELEARAMAHSGIAIGLHPLVSQKTPVLEEEVSSTMGYNVRIVGEGGRLNINWLITGAEEEQEPKVKLTILKLWLETHGLDFKQRERFIDCLFDYVDADDLKRLNGAENEEGYQPANRQLVSLDEIEKIKGVGPLLKSPGWKDELTIHSQGPIDLSSADAPVLKLLPGLSDARIQRFLQIRRGRDGVDGTVDDFEFKTMKEVQSYLGFSDAQFRSLSGYVIIKDQTQRIVSKGRSANVVRQVEVVARKGSANPAILYWQE